VRIGDNGRGEGKGERMSAFVGVSIVDFFRKVLNVCETSRMKDGCHCGTARDIV